jgi:hypothetical protein
MGKFQASIRWQLLIVIIILVTIPVIVLGMLAYKTSKEEIYNSVEEKLSEQSLMIKDYIRTSMEITQEKVNSDLKVADDIIHTHQEQMLILGEVWSNDEKFKNYLKNPSEANYEDARSRLLEFRDNYDHIDSLAILNTDNIPVVLSDKEGQGKQVNEKFINDALAGEEINILRVVPLDMAQTKYKLNYPFLMFLTIIPIYDDNQIIGVLTLKDIVNYDHTIVDKIQDVVGGTATIFQLRDDGEFVRVSTNVLKENG